MNEQKILKVLLSPIFTEKSASMGKHDQYLFKVSRDSTKPEIKAAVEKFFNVNVVSVQVVNSKPKKVRFGKIEGMRKAWKKAYVRIAAGQEIDFTGAKA